MNKTHAALQKDLIEIHTLDKTDKSLIDKIDNGLMAYNSEHAHAPYKAKTIAAFRQGMFIGGIFFRWYKQHAAIQKLWVGENNRKQGVGNRLLAAAEKELHRQGCRRIIVDTISFQAPDFYRRNGYQLIATVPDYLENAERAYFAKNLPERMSDE
jgi:ribosomal protein S18 acetylase RimI-like enzyme